MRVPLFQVQTTSRAVGTHRDAGIRVRRPAAVREIHWGPKFPPAGRTAAWITVVVDRGCGHATTAFPCASTAMSASGPMIRSRSRRGSCLRLGAGQSSRPEGVSPLARSARSCCYESTPHTCFPARRQPRRLHPRPAGCRKIHNQRPTGGREISTGRQPPRGERGSAHPKARAHVARIAATIRRLVVEAWHCASCKLPCCHPLPVTVSRRFRASTPKGGRPSLSTDVRLDASAPSWRRRVVECQLQDFRGVLVTRNGAERLDARDLVELQRHPGDLGVEARRGDQDLDGLARAELDAASGTAP